MILTLIIGDCTLLRFYMPPEFTPAFNLSDIWDINNDKVKQILSVKYIEVGQPRSFRLELANHM